MAVMITNNSSIWLLIFIFFVDFYKKQNLYIFKVKKPKATWGSKVGLQTQNFRNWDKRLKRPKLKTQKQMVFQSKISIQ